jgi:hypothetical protein
MSIPIPNALVATATHVFPVRNPSNLDPRSPAFMSPRTTEYLMFFPAVGILNIFTSSALHLIRFHNNSSLHRRNVALNKIISVSALAMSPNSCNFRPNLDSMFKITCR